MNKLQAFALETVARIVPDLREAIVRSGNTMSALVNEINSGSGMRMLRRQADAETRAELQEAAVMAGSGPSMGAPLREGATLLDLQLDDRQYRRLSAFSQVQFSRSGLARAIQIARLYRIVDPLIKRAVSISSDYVFGRGVEIRSENPTANEVIQDFLNDPDNKRELGHVGFCAKDATLTTDGNVFFALFEVNGAVKVRTIDATEIQDIVTDPEDSSKVLYYKRIWAQRKFDPSQINGGSNFETMTRWYPDIDNTEPEKVAMIGGNPVEVKTPVQHVKVGGLEKWLYGIPEIWAAVPWARAYKELLQDYATRTRTLAQLGYDVEVKGGAPMVQAADQALSSQLSTAPNQGIDRNPSTVTGSTITHGPGMKVNPIGIRGASNDPEEGRRIGLQVCSAAGLPETMVFGDTSTGSLATAQSLDRPTELKFLQRQELWRDVILRMLRHVVSRDIKSGKGQLRAAIVKTKDGAKILESVQVIGPVYQQNGRRVVERWNITLEARKRPEIVPITVRFPSILEHDIKAIVDAIVSAMTLNARGGDVLGIDERTGVGLLLHELGYEDPDTLLELMYPLAEYKKIIDRTKQAPEPPEVTLDPQTKEAISELRRAIEAIRTAQAAA